MAEPWLTIIGIGEDGLAGLTDASRVALQAVQAPLAQQDNDRSHEDHRQYARNHLQASGLPPEEHPTGDIGAPRHQVEIIQQGPGRGVAIRRIRLRGQEHDVVEIGEKGMLDVHGQRRMCVGWQTGQGDVEDDAQGIDVGGRLSRTFRGDVSRRSGKGSVPDGFRQSHRVDESDSECTVE